MGMTCTLWRVTEADVQRLAHASGDQIAEFLFGKPIEPPKRSGLIGWLKSLSPITIEAPPELPTSPEGGGTDVRAEIDLDKAWHGLHFLFTSTVSEGDEPACFLLKGGDDLGEDEIGDSIPRVLRPVQVQQFVRFLSQLSTEELTRRYDPARMTKLEIYPEVWDRDRESAMQSLLDAFEELRDFVSAVAAEGEAIVVLVN
jgi:hypothetical protein